jgi:hypothetical protein
MALEIPVDWATIEDAIYDWMFGATAIVTDWTNEDRPERPFPYTTLKRGGSLSIQPNAELVEVTNLGAPAGEEIEQTLSTDDEFTVSCQCRTAADAPGTNANDYLTSAKAALQKPDVRQALRDAGAIVVEAEPVLDLDQIVGEQWTSGASMDVRFRTLAQVTATTGYIAKVGVEGTLKDVDGSTVVNYSEDIPP